VREGGHTSQLLRIKQRDLTTDLSGPKPPGESLTPRSNSTMASDTVDLEFGFFSSAAALGSRVSSGRTISGPSSGRAVPTLSEITIRGGDQDDRVHVPPGFPPSEIEGMDGEGLTPSSPLRPLSTATSTSAFPLSWPLSLPCAVIGSGPSG